LRKIPHDCRGFLPLRYGPPGPMMAAMKTHSLRSQQRIAQVKFVALPLEAMDLPVAPLRVEFPVLRLEARLMRWLRRFASRVIGSPAAARP